LAEAEVVSGAPEPSANTVTAIYPLADNATPSYPASGLKAGCGEGLVPIRIHVGIDGRVSDIRPIPGRSIAEDACYKEFWAAVSASVAKWTFVPAYRVRTIPSEAPGGEPTVERTPMGLDLDYEFMFTIVNGKATVSSK
jgi:outer membrane biosynthesis protein TonB